MTRLVILKFLRSWPSFETLTQEWALEARWLCWLTLVWLVFGLLILYSASYPVAVAEKGNGGYYVLIQLLWVMLGLCGFNWIVKTPLDRLLKLSGVLVLALLVLISFTLIPSMGVTVNGATRWLALGPFLVQPSELMKPCLVLQSARLFGRWHQLSWATRLCWLSIFSIILAVILLQPNLSTAVVIGLILWLIALASGIPWSYLLLTAFGGAISAFLSVNLNPYQRQRIVSFLNPWVDPGGNGYQLIQSLLAIASGGVWGAGFGLSEQKLLYLPIQYTDFIFAVYAEEFGFIGSLLLLMLLAAYASLALRVALKAIQPLHRLVAVGAMTVLVGQALMNIGVAIGSLPTTGLPFPMLSYGGSSMLASLASAGLLVRAAREINGANTVVELPVRRQRWQVISGGR